LEFRSIPFSVHLLAFMFMFACSYQHFWPDSQPVGHCSVQPGRRLGRIGLKWSRAAWNRVLALMASNSPAPQLHRRFRVAMSALSFWPTATSATATCCTSHTLPIFNQVFILSHLAANLHIHGLICGMWLVFVIRANGDNTM